MYITSSTLDFLNQREKDLRLQQYNRDTKQYETRMDTNTNKTTDLLPEVPMDSQRYVQGRRKQSNKVTIYSVI